MELNFTLTLTEELWRDLIADCTECSCSPKQWASEAVEAAIASRRLPKVPEAAYGAQMCGTRRAGHEDEDEEFHPIEHRILL